MVALWREIVGRTSLGFAQKPKEGAPHTHVINQREPACVLSLQLEGMIPAQNERWRRGLGMQVAREIR